MLYLLFVPAAFAAIAIKTDKYMFKMFQTLACLAVVVIMGVFFKANNFFYLGSAFLASIAGDYFLSFKSKNENYFIYGILLYFLAHLGYLLYIVMSFRLNFAVLLIAGAIIIGGYLSYYFVFLKKCVSGILNAAVITYLLISCIVLSLSFAAETLFWVKALTVAGIALIVISDTIIAESDFRGNKRFSFWILPTYYAAQILLSASYILLNMN